MLDAGQQDYLVMIFSIVVVGAAGFGMLSALGHFMMRVSKKPKRRQKYLLRQERMSRKVCGIDSNYYRFELKFLNNY